MIHFTQSAGSLGLSGNNPRIGITGATPTSLTTAVTMVHNILPLADLGGTDIHRSIPHPVAQRGPT